MKHSSAVKYGWGLIFLAACMVLPAAAFGQSGPAFDIVNRFIAANPELLTAEGVFEEEGGGGPAPEKTGVLGDAIATADDYFPLFPGARWTYEVTTDQVVQDTRTVLKNTATVKGVKTSIIQSASDKYQAFYTSDVDGIRLHGQFAPRVTVPGRGTYSVRTTMIPPIVLLQDLTPGAKPRQTGTVEGVVSGRKATLTYTADYTVSATQTITTTAGVFDAIGVSYKLTLQGGGTTDTETGDIFFGKAVGEIMEAYTNSDGSTEAVLTATTSNVHDLAVTNISAPALIALTDKVPIKNAAVKVTIQNRSIYPETIPDLAALTGLVTVTAESLGGCPDPVPVISAANKKFPIVMKSKGTLMINYDVPISCANDSSKNISKDPAHYDYRFIATVNTAALEGNTDGHTWDDVCPRSVTPPYLVDYYPDSTIKDKGCGAKKADGTFGGDIFLDVTAVK